jgi:hypothetical protein
MLMLAIRLSLLVTIFLVVQARAEAVWKKDFTIVEYMRVYDFPEQQVNYPVEIPAGIKPESLTLLSQTGSSIQSIPFQLSNECVSGEGLKAKLSFRTDLPRGATRLFRLVSGFGAKDIASLAIQPPALRATNNPQEAILGNSLLLVKVPAGHQDFAQGKPFAQVAAPILGLARASAPQPWMVTGSFSAPDSLLVISTDAKLIESGPLFAQYQVTYQFQDGKSYTVTLELRANESFVRIAEAAKGFAPDDDAFIQLNYGQGLLDPDQCLVATNGGYGAPGTGLFPYSGGYDEHVSTNAKFVPWSRTTGWSEYDPKRDDSKEGRLSYCLGLFAPNALGVMHATAFYKDQGTDALLLVLDRLAEWKNYERSLWTDFHSPDALRFYSQDGRKYMAAALAGPQRFWVAGLIPRDDMKLTVLPGITRALPAGPEVRLFNQLTDWSLDSYKDRAVDWPEKLTAGPFAAPNFSAEAPLQKVTYDEYDKKNEQNSTFFQWVVNDSWDFSAGLGAVSFRGMPERYGEYALSRSSWTQEQRDRIRQILLFFADSSAGDNNQPHHNMLSGHPNFIMDVKTTLPLAAATFPNHPRARIWRDAFMEFYNEWLDQYDRKDVPELNTKGGRWTENISCYVGQCFVGLDLSQRCLKAYDGTSLGQNPQLLELIRWMRDSFMSPNDGVRLIPPEGAHSFNFEPGHTGRKVLFRLSAQLAQDNPQLAAEMHWIDTNGKEGRKPDIHSALYTDYGPVFHHDFGGPHESYAHLQNTFGLSYRWHGAGVVYYGAKNKVWSYNTAETDGDEYDINQLSAFNVNGKGLTAGPTDQLLYDFDFAQFYRQPGKEGDDYLARGVMLLRDDYLVLSDEVRDATIPGTFNWVNVYDLPQIYQLKPGAPMVNKISIDPKKAHPTDPVRTAQLRSYSGQGDFLTVVAPDAVTAVATPFGATVNGEYVFASQKPEDIAQSSVVFTGNYGYARPNQLALFQGAKIGLDGFVLSRNGGDFGVSAAAEPNKITGRIVGRSGGKISVVPPAGLNPASASVTIGGKPVAHTVEQGAITFSVEIAQGYGLKNYTITF